MIGSKYAASASNNNNAAQPPATMCDSIICPVDDPHEATPFSSTSKKLPFKVTFLEAKKEKNGSDNIFLNKFYTVHWDNINQPFPAPIKECIDKSCRVRERHEDKFFSTNPKKANLCPDKIQQIWKKTDLSKEEGEVWEGFWRIHGPRVEAKGSSNPGDGVRDDH